MGRQVVRYCNWSKIFLEAQPFWSGGWANNPASTLLINSPGNVGIGCINPKRRLDVTCVPYDGSNLYTGNENYLIGYNSVANTKLLAGTTTSSSFFIDDLTSDKKKKK